MTTDRRRALRLLPPRVRRYVTLLADVNDIDDPRKLRSIERETRSMLPQMADGEMELAHRLLRRMDEEDAQQAPPVPSPNTPLVRA